MVYRHLRVFTDVSIRIKAKFNFLTRQKLCFDRI